MERLPTELIGEIFRALIESHSEDKNTVLQARLVCKAFDAAAKNQVLATLQLDLVGFASLPFPSVSALDSAGSFFQGLYVDASIIRDEVEVNKWRRLFQCPLYPHPAITSMLNDFQQYCLSDTGFSEVVFRDLLNNVLSRTPNLKRLNLGLPLQMLGYENTAGTILLATTLASIHERGSRAEEDLGFSRLEALVLEEVGDRCIRAICRNPIDLNHARYVFESLKHFVITIKRDYDLDAQYARDFWLLVSYATKLVSLAVNGRRMRGVRNVQHVPASTGQILDTRWHHSFLAYKPLSTPSILRHLKRLELSHLEVFAGSLLSLIEQHQDTLKELHLTHVYLRLDVAETEKDEILWIGYDSPYEAPETKTWVARGIREISGLKLDVLRVSCLGYDIYDNDLPVHDGMLDLVDPTGRRRSFEQRFVEAASSGLSSRTTPILETQMYDIEAHRQKCQGTISELRYSLDGMFRNQSIGTEKRLKELMGATEAALRIADGEIERINSIA